MANSLENLFNTYVFSTGRRVFAIRQVKPIAQELGHKQLVGIINRALEHEVKTLRLESSWQAAGYDSDPQRVKKVDNKVDRMFIRRRVRSTLSRSARNPRRGTR